MIIVAIMRKLKFEFRLLCFFLELSMVCKQVAREWWKISRSAEWGVEESKLRYITVFSHKFSYVAWRSYIVFDISSPELSSFFLKVGPSQMHNWMASHSNWQFEPSKILTIGSLKLIVIKNALNPADIYNVQVHFTYPSQIEAVERRLGIRRWLRIQALWLRWYKRWSH